MRPIPAKTIISAGNGVNLYRGCTHGCIYCDSRSLCYQNADFDHPGFKERAIHLMRAELARRRHKAMITTGAMSDPYVHLEAELGLTRDMLHLLREFGLGVGILTKSDLALRDIALIEAVNARHRSVVCYTVTTFDDDLCLLLEPQVCPSSRRFDCLERFARRGIPTGVWLVPILPFINDSEDNIRAIVRRCGEVGVTYIMAWDFGTTMRDGSREHFYYHLDRLFPGLKRRYQERFGSSYVCLSPQAARLREVFEQECGRLGILFRHDEIRRLFHPRGPEQQLLDFDACCSFAQSRTPFFASLI